MSVAQAEIIPRQKKEQRQKAEGPLLFADYLESPAFEEDVELINGVLIPKMSAQREHDF